MYHHRKPDLPECLTFTPQPRFSHGRSPPVIDWRHDVIARATAGAGEFGAAAPSLTMATASAATFTDAESV